jgi:hypothetical protein
LKIFNFYAIIFIINILLGENITCDRANDLDPTGEYSKNMDIINSVFDLLQNSYKNISVFDVRRFPNYIQNVRCNNIFIEDAVHFTEEVNNWVAEEIIKTN